MTALFSRLFDALSQRVIQLLTVVVLGRMRAEGMRQVTFSNAATGCISMLSRRPGTPGRRDMCAQKIALAYTGMYQLAMLCTPLRKPAVLASTAAKQNADRLMVNGFEGTVRQVPGPGYEVVELRGPDGRPAASRPSRLSSWVIHGALRPYQEMFAEEYRLIGATD